MVIKIVILGPESTGKSTLSEQLALHYKTLWVEEYAREYLHINGKDYVYEDLYHIAAGQIKNEDDALAKIVAAGAYPVPLFIDTNLHVIKVWSDFVFNKTDERIEKIIAERTYDLYLLCDVDLPWVEDELREYPDLETRKKLFDYYHDIMEQQQVPWAIIKGNYQERLELAIKHVDGYLNSKKL